ncbi:hypothetical protein NEOKW01_2093 [Nematocida sp. AWRm80]|nr:hypothetical protein NEOKW01_2093 [Nematocida sp. AWRm80]
MVYHIFSHPYILIEDESGKHRPFYKEYSGETKDSVVPKVLLEPVLNEKKKTSDNKSRVGKRSGVCELCVVRYSDYDSHIQDKMHIITSKAVVNYTEIDSIIALLNAQKRIINRRTTRKRLFKQV